MKSLFIQVSLRSKLIFVFFFSIATHIPGLTSPILDYHGWAQALRASIARNYYEGGMRFFNPEVDFFSGNAQYSFMQFPLYSYLIAIFYKMFGENDLWGRVISILFAGGSAVYLYLLARRFLEDKTAFLCSLIFCCIPIRIYFMRVIMPEPTAIFSLLAGLYYVTVWMDAGKFFFHGFLGCVFLNLAPLLKLPYLLLVFPAFYLVFLKFGNGWIRTKEFWILSLSFLFLFGSWHIGARAGGEGSLVTVNKAVFFKGEMSSLQEWMSGEFWSTHFLSRFPELLTTYSGLLFFVLGFANLWKVENPDQKRASKFFMFWFLSTILYIILVGRYGRIHQYASLPFAPVNSVFIAVGAAALWNRWQPELRWKTLWCLLMLSIPVHAALRIRHWYNLNEDWVFRAKEVVSGISKPSDLFYINAFDQTFYLYHIRRKGFVGTIPESGLDYLDETIGKGAKYFFSPSYDGWQRHEPIFEKRFQRVYQDQDFLIYDLAPLKKLNSG